MAAALQPRIVIVGVYIGIDCRERRDPEQRQRVGDAAGGFQRLRFARIRDTDAEARAVAQRLLDLRAEMRMIDHDLPDARRGKFFNVPDNQRLAAGHEQATWASHR